MLRAPVRADLRELANDQPLDPWTRGLVVVVVGSVVADLWVGQDNNLSGVGGISKNFLIAGDGSIKNYFPVTFAFGSVAFASEDSAVFQRKDGLHLVSGGVDFKDSNRRSNRPRRLPEEKLKRKSFPYRVPSGVTGGVPFCLQANTQKLPCHR